MDLTFSITKDYMVDHEVVAKVAEDFAEWLEVQGYPPTWSRHFTETEELSYEDLAKKFAESLLNKYDEL